MLPTPRLTCSPFPSPLPARSTAALLPCAADTLNECSLDGIASPDNVNYIPELDTLLIAEVTFYILVETAFLGLIVPACCAGSRIGRLGQGGTLFTRRGLWVAAALEGFGGCG